jgi:hypothetical protein
MHWLGKNQAPRINNNTLAINETKTKQGIETIQQDRKATNSQAEDKCCLLLPQKRQHG